MGDSAESSLRAWPKPPDVSNEESNLESGQVDNTLYVSKSHLLKIRGNLIGLELE